MCWVLGGGCAEPGAPPEPPKASLLAAPAVAGAAAAEFVWSLPPGIEPPSVPADNPMSAKKVALGRRLFYDTRLSRTGDFSCASCHQLARGFSDGRGRAIGSTGERHVFGAPGLANVAYATSLGWASPELRSLEAQAAIPMFDLHPVELGLTGIETEVEDALRVEPRYRDAFAEVFPDDAEPIRLGNVRRAIAAFERTLLSFDSAYDRWVWRAEAGALSPDARAGARLFFSDRLGCSACHGNTASVGRSIPKGVAVRGADFRANGLAVPSIEDAEDAREVGLEARTGKAEDRGRFRVPSLRNLARTAPYMHDGRYSTLERVIDHYERGGDPGAPADLELRSFSLSVGERGQLIAYFESLTDGSFLSNPRFADPWVNP
jgi:cytochrome c peroxidase